MNFNRFTYKFRERFRDSYGFDKLSKYMLITGSLLLILNSSPLFGAMLVGYSTWRALSKNKYKRYQELSAFENSLYTLRQKFKNPTLRLQDFRHYKVFKCPNCSQKLRVPRKQGNVVITCKTCRTEFKGKS